jgi:hypothetical protein
MAQTPISASANFSSTTPTTLYTVPAGATAVVKSVIPTSVIGASATVTLNKVSSTGTVYPLAVAAETTFPYANSTYYNSNQVANLNLLPGPITLIAGESISISTSTATYFKDPISISNTNYKLYGANYVNGNYVALGQDTSTGYGLVLTSTDGITWTQRTFNFYVITQDITFGNGYYAICNQSTTGVMHYSTDLVTWTQVSLPVSGYAMYSITFGNNKFVVGGTSGKAYSATSTPVTWTAITFPNGGLGSTINSIMYAGTNYVFGTDGATFTTTDLSTFATPSYAYDVTSVSPSNLAATTTTFFQSINTAINPDAARAVQYTTTGATWANVSTLSTTNGCIQTASYALAFGNGALILFQRSWDGSTLKYSRSSNNGSTWTNENSTVTNYGTGGNCYAQQAYPIVDTTRNYVCFNISNNLQLNAVDSTGVVTNTAALNFTLSFFTQRVNWAGNPTTGSWIAPTTGYVTNQTQYWGWWFGTGPTNGSNAQNTDAAVYIPGSGNCTASSYMPGSNGFLMGTSLGYIFYTSTYNDGPYGGDRPTAVSSPVAAFAVDGNTATSKIVYVQANGYGAVSIDQGGTWTTMRIPGSSFGTQATYAGKCLQYANGVWIAVNTAGQTFYSTSGLVWSTAPVAVNNLATLNSNNVFLTTSGVFTTSGTGVTSFTLSNSTAYSGFPSIRNLAYVGSKYLIGYGSSIYQSTDLATWTAASVSNTSINNISYWATVNGSPLLADGSGNVLPVGAKRNSPTAEGKIGKPITIANALVVGNATAGIVEIT